MDARCLTAGAGGALGASLRLAAGLAARTLGPRNGFRTTDTRLTGVNAAGVAGAAFAVVRDDEAVVAEDVPRLAATVRAAERTRVAKADTSDVSRRRDLAVLRWARGGALEGGVR